MSNMVTRCPKCATSFRITSAQLQSAKGAVRCGSCLHIFKAHDHLVKLDTGSASSTPVIATIPNKTTAGVSNQAPRDNAPQGSRDNTPQASRNSATQPSTATSVKAAAATLATPTVATAPFENTVPHEEPGLAEASSEPELSTTPPENEALAFDQAAIDEELAALDDDILISDNMDQKQDTSSELFDDFLMLSNQNSFSLFERNLAQSKTEEVTDTVDESWAESLLDEADDEARFEAVKHRISATEEAENDGTDNLAHAAEEDRYSSYPNHLFSLIDDDQASPTMDERERDTELDLLEEFRRTEEAQTASPPPPSDVSDSSTRASETPIRAYDTSRAALLMNIMPEPVVMTGRNKRRARQRRLWLSLSLLMVVLLAVQIAWLQFDKLSRISPYRSVYGWLCPYLGCQLPTLVDKNEIRVRNLLVRKHPEATDALIVDVILLNTAPFAQPFPDLVMEFSDIDAAPVAARRFTPSEYLRGELAGYQLMPQNQPIHINLELVDPGEAAVNYRIQPY